MSKLTIVLLNMKSLIFDFLYFSFKFPLFLLFIPLLWTIRSCFINIRNPTKKAYSKKKLRVWRYGEFLEESHGGEEGLDSTSKPINPVILLSKQYRFISYFEGVVAPLQSTFSNALVHKSAGINIYPCIEILFFIQNALSKSRWRKSPRKFKFKHSRKKKCNK